MHERNIVFAALCAALFTAGAAQAEVVELATLEKRALERQALLEAGSFRERAAKAEVAQAESAYRPHIGMSVEANAAPGRALRQLPGEKGFFVQGAPALAPENYGEAFMPRPRTGVGVELSANLYDFGRTEAAVSAGRAKVRAAEADQALTRVQVIQSVRARYLSWLSAHELHRIAVTASSDATRRRERVAALISEGARPRTDLSPVDADRLLSELERERAEGDLEAARVALEQDIGESLSTAAEPDSALLDQPMPAPEASRAPNPALRMLLHQRNALTATARVQRKQRAPILTTALGAGVYGILTEKPDGDNENEYSPSFSAFPTYSAGLTLTIPLWDGGESAAAAEASEARASELGIRLESAERSQQQEIERARLDAEHAKKREAVAQQLLDVCKTRVSDTDAGYELGAMQFDQVQQARALLRRAETELVLAKIAHAEAVLRVAP